MKAQMKKLILVVVLIAAVIGITYAVKSIPKKILPPQQALYKTNEDIRDQKIVLGDYVRYPGKTGQTAFELLKVSNVSFESKQYDFGVFIESLNGVKPDKDHFWKLYLNGQEAQVGADKLETHDGDTIEWKLEKINAEEKK